MEEEDFTGWGWSITRIPDALDDDRLERGTIDDSPVCVQGHVYPEDVEVEDRWKVCPECRAENELKMRLHCEIMKRRLHNYS